MTLKKSPEMWATEFGIQVMDPDGWRFDQRHSGKVVYPHRSYYDPITLSEFSARMMVSTCTWSERSLENMSIALKTYAEDK